MMESGFMKTLSRWMGLASLMVAGLFSSSEVFARCDGEPIGAALAAATQDKAQETTVTALIKQDGRYSIFARILDESGLGSTLAGKGPFTVFVPSNAAFAGLQPEALERLFEPQNKSKLAALVMAHVLPGRISSAQWSENPSVGIALGGDVLTYVPGGAGRINDAPLEQVDREAANGIIHSVGAPLAPTLIAGIVPAFSGIGGQP